MINARDQNLQAIAIESGMDEKYSSKVSNESQINAFKFFVNRGLYLSDKDYQAALLFTDELKLSALKAGMHEDFACKVTNELQLEAFKVLKEGELNQKVGEFNFISIKLDSYKNSSWKEYSEGALSFKNDIQMSALRAGIYYRTALSVTKQIQIDAFKEGMQGKHILGVENKVQIQAFKAIKDKAGTSNDTVSMTMSYSALAIKIKTSKELKALNEALSENKSPLDATSYALDVGAAKVLNLEKDFTPGPQFQDRVDESYSAVETFTKNDDGDLYYVKSQITINGVPNQLIASKIKQHFLDYASEDKLLEGQVTIKEYDRATRSYNDKSVKQVYIASKEVPNLKTLNQVGHMCDSKDITGVENMLAVNLLVGDMNNETKNLGFITKEDKCVAIKIDLDETQFNVGKDFAGVLNQYLEYQNTYYSSAYNLTFTIGNETNQIFLDDDGDKKKLNLDEMSKELRDKFQSQISAGKDSITLTDLDLLNLFGEYGFSISATGRSGIAYKDSFLDATLEIIRTEEKVFKSIIDEALEEVGLYYTDEELFENYRWKFSDCTKEDILTRLSDYFLTQIKVVQNLMLEHLVKVKSDTPISYEMWEKSGYDKNLYKGVGYETLKDVITGFNDSQLEAFKTLINLFSGDNFDEALEMVSLIDTPAFLEEVKESLEKESTDLSIGNMEGIMDIVDSAYESIHISGSQEMVHEEL